MGRAYGNLGNAHYRLGSFETAIECHLERYEFWCVLETIDNFKHFRLSIAEQHQDIAAQRRAYTNLGNANVFLADYVDAVEYYQKG